VCLVYSRSYSPNDCSMVTLSEKKRGFTIYKVKATTIILNNRTNIKICENNVLYQKCEGHIGGTTLITRKKGVGGTWV